MTEHHQVLIVGGGTAGLSIAARLRAVENPPAVTIVEPSNEHYYQPIWTLVGAGVFPKEVSVRDEADFIPPGATWLRDAVATFEPEKNQVTTKAGKVLTYEQLVVAPGIQLDWGAVAGLRDTLGKNGVCSNYAYDTVDSTWESIRNFKGGTAIFTFPSTPIKCAGAPQKIMYLAEHAFRRQGVRNASRVIFASAGAAIFGVPKYRAALEKIIEARGIETMYLHDLVEVRGATKEAVFADKASGTQVTVKYDMLHVTPPQSAPDFIEHSPLAGAGGWVDVDEHTLQHVRFPNVFSAGDCSSLPTSKTGAAVRKEAPVLVENLLALRAGRPLLASYDGYASCPLVTGYGTVMLAEFGYDGKIMESFPFDQAQERYSMWVLKAHALPSMYWHGMLRGRM